MIFNNFNAVLILSTSAAVKFIRGGLTGPGFMSVTKPIATFIVDTQEPIKNTIILL